MIMLKEEELGKQISNEGIQRGQYREKAQET